MLANYPAATVAAFDPTCGNLPRRQLDVPRLHQFLAALEQAGAEAVLLASSTGQGHLRTVDELRQWLLAAGEAPLRRMMKMVLLRPEDGMAANRILLQAAQAAGCGVVFFRPGTDLPDQADDDQVVGQLQPLVESAAKLDLGVGLYSIPDVSGLPLTADAAARIVQGPGGEHVVAIKVTEADFERSTRTFLHHPDLAHLKIVQGWDPHLAQALQEGPGRCGVTSGPMSLAIHQYQHMLAAAARRDWQELLAAQEAVSLVFASMQDDPARFADLQRAKYIMGLGHPLTGSVTEDHAERVLDAVAQTPRSEDRSRIARSLDLLGDGPYHQRLQQLAAS